MKYERIYESFLSAHARAIKNIIFNDLIAISMEVKMLIQYHENSEIYRQ